MTTIDPSEYLAQLQVNIGLTNDVNVLAQHNVSGEEALDVLESAIAPFRAVLDKATTAIDDTDVTAVNAQIKELIELLTLGVVGTDGLEYLSVNSVKDVEILLQSVKSIAPTAIISNPASSNITLVDLQEWASLAKVNSEIGEVVSRLENAALAGRITFDPTDPSNRLQGSLQALVELIYVRGANKLLSDNLESLESALTTTKTALETLTELQNIHNNTTVVSTGIFPFDTRFGGVDTTTGFKTEAEEYFGTPPVPTVGPGLSNIFELMKDYELVAAAIQTDLFNTKYNNTDTSGLFGALSAKIGSQITQASDDALLENLMTWTKKANEYNLIVKRINTELEPINSLLEAAGIQSVQLKNGSVVTVGSTYKLFIDEDVNQGTWTTGYELPLLPLPKFTASQLVNNTLTAGSTLATQIEEFVQAAAPFVDANGITKSSIPRFVPTSGGIPGALGFFPFNFAVTIFNQDVILNGIPDQGIPPHPIVDFYKKITSQFDKIEDTLAALKNDASVADSNSLYSRINTVFGDLSGAGLGTLRTELASVQFRPAVDGHVVDLWNTVAAADL